MVTFVQISCSNTKKVNRMSSIGYDYLFLDSKMNDKKKVCVCGNERNIERKKKERDELFFFCLLSKCSIRLLSYRIVTERKLKKWKEKRHRVFNDSSTFFLTIGCLCVFVFVTLRLFSLCVRARIWRLQIHECERE